jgi:hypothetical protein
VVGSTTDYLWFERTTPSVPAKEASQHLISGAATPPWLAKEGNALGLKPFGSYNEREEQ